MTPLLQVSNYQKSYDHGSTTVLHIQQLYLPKGLYWLKGENGSGKTTFLKSVAGLVPFEGKISVEGFDLRKQRTHYRQIVNWAEAEPVYPDFLTGNDLIAFYQSAKGGSTASLKNLVSLSGAEKFLNRKTGSYSTGMIKKLSLLLAFMGQPKLILLDEPLITLDTQTVPIIGKLIKQYYEQGVSFLISSHQPVDETIGLRSSILTIRDHTIV
jgi:ABC-2 type transport system ATP-binding protein